MIRMTALLVCEVVAPRAAAFPTPSFVSNVLQQTADCSIFALT
jgi:hypothetical protein